MPKKGQKLTSAQKRSRARKAAITRCKNKCDETGGAKKAGRKMSSSNKKKAAARLGPWMKHLAQFRLDNPDVKGKDVMIQAAKTYKK